MSNFEKQAFSKIAVANRLSKKNQAEVLSKNLRDKKGSQNFGDKFIKSTRIDTARFGRVFCNEGGGTVQSRQKKTKFRCFEINYQFWASVKFSSAERSLKINWTLISYFEFIQEKRFWRLRKIAAFFGSQTWSTKILGWPQKFLNPQKNLLTLKKF